MAKHSDPIANGPPPMNVELPGPMVGFNRGLMPSEPKLDWTLVPWEAVEPIVRVLMFGCIKHPGRENWRTVSLAHHKESFIRHVISYMKGERKDPETGQSHLAHAGCRLFFLLVLDK